MRADLARLAPGRRRARLIGLAAGAALLVAALLLVRFEIRGRDATWAHIQQTGVWRVGMDPSFPPFENLDAATGRPIGFDVDFAQAIAEAWGVRVEIVSIGFDQLVDAVAANRIDSALSALPVFEERAREVSFSRPYFDAGLVLAAPRSAEIGGLDDLAGRRVAAEWGSGGDAEVRALNRRVGGSVTPVLRDSSNAALDAVLAGDADAALVDAVDLALYDRGQGRLVAVGRPVQSDPYVIIVPVDAPKLLAALDETLAALDADGVLGQLRARWLEENRTE